MEFLKSLNLWLLLNLSFQPLSLQLFSFVANSFSSPGILRSQILDPLTLYHKFLFNFSLFFWIISIDLKLTHSSVISLLKLIPQFLISDIVFSVLEMPIWFLFRVSIILLRTSFLFTSKVVHLYLLDHDYKLTSNTLWDKAIIWVISHWAPINIPLRTGQIFLALCMSSNLGWYAGNVEYHALSL